jgi:hypothetical protein
MRFAIRDPRFHHAVICTSVAIHGSLCGLLPVTVHCTIEACYCHLPSNPAPLALVLVNSFTHSPITNCSWLIQFAGKQQAACGTAYQGVRKEYPARL